MIKKLIATTILVFAITTNVFAENVVYTVQSGDSMWKIAVKNEVGISEIQASNPQVTNAALIYPGQKLTIPSNSDVKLQENEVIKLVNVQRSKVGLPALKANWQVCRVARYKSQDMINKNYFSHTSPTYGSPFKMMETFGVRFSAAGENIAYGQKTPAAVMVSWMNSPGHRSNILNPTYTEIGVGLAKSSNGTCYWTQMFLKP
jgi:uncharacterized YkwD family protein/spore coat assembly protein SafA